jgi:predicted PurR-regulated permease PerM
VLPERSDPSANPAEVMPDPDARSRRIIRLVFAGLVFGLALWTARSYLVAIGWAVIIAISVWPSYRQMRTRLHGRRFLAPLVATCALVVLLMIPFAVVLVEIGREAQVTLDWLQNAQQSGIPVPEWTRRLPVLGGQLEQWWRLHLSTPNSPGAFLATLNSQEARAWVGALGGEIASRLLLALLTFITLFLLLRDGEWIGRHVFALIDRWLGGPGDRLAEKLGDAVRGVVNGTVLVALGEGLLIGIAYVLAGVPHAVLFALLTVAFAMLPMGAWFAFAAATLVLLVSGGTILAGVAVVLWGAAVMLVGDNLVQPALIGGAVRMPFLLTIIGILGGLETFGLIGLFLGPLVMVALLTIWREWVERDDVAADAISATPPRRTP